MSIEATLKSRSNGQCELCTSGQALGVYEVPPVAANVTDREIYICVKCRQQLDKKEELDSNHWRKLHETMWSEYPAVQVAAWRMLNRLRNESWAAEALDMLYLDDEQLEWAKATGDHEGDGSVELHRDCNGHQLFDGDSVVLIKSLDVKGATLNVRMGTVVKNIRLVPDNTEQIEGRVEGQLIVILTKYLRKQQAGT